MINSTSTVLNKSSNQITNDVDNSNNKISENAKYTISRALTSSAYGASVSYSALPTEQIKAINLNIYGIVFDSLISGLQVRTTDDMRDGQITKAVNIIGEKLQYKLKENYIDTIKNGRVISNTDEKIVSEFMSIFK